MTLALSLLRFISQRPLRRLRARPAARGLTPAQLEPVVWAVTGMMDCMRVCVCDDALNGVYSLRVTITQRGSEAN